MISEMRMSALVPQPQAQAWEEVSIRLHTIQALQATISVVKAMVRLRVNTVRLRVTIVYPLQATVIVAMVMVLHKVTIVQALLHTKVTVRLKETTARTLHVVMVINRITAIPNIAIWSRTDRIHLMVTNPSDLHRIKEATISPATPSLAIPLKITNKATLSKAILRSIISRAIPKNIISKAIRRHINLSKVTVSQNIVAVNIRNIIISNGISFLRY
jgi:hypothetical protein